MRVNAMALLPAALATQTMATTLDFGAALASKGEALHTTRVIKWGATVARTRESIFIQRDGRSLRMVGTQAMWPALGRDEPYEATGEIDSSGTRATYSIPWLGTATIDQRTEIVPGGLRLTQDTRGSHAEVVLLRR
jgi:hypothetical protein